MKKRQNDMLENRADKPVSKESAKMRYEQLCSEERDEPALPFESLAEAKIKSAMADGAFDNLEGKGKPIDLRDYYALPEHLRMGYQMLKDSGFLPEEVRLKKEMELLKEQIRQCASEKEKKTLRKRLADTTQQYHFHMEYNNTFKK